MRVEWTKVLKNGRGSDQEKKKVKKNFKGKIRKITGDPIPKRRIPNNVGSITQKNPNPIARKVKRKRHTRKETKVRKKTLGGKLKLWWGVCLKNSWGRQQNIVGCVSKGEERQGGKLGSKSPPGENTTITSTNKVTVRKPAWEGLVGNKTCKKDFFQRLRSVGMIISQKIK